MMNPYGDTLGRGKVVFELLVNNDKSETESYRVEEILSKTKDGDHSLFTEQIENDIYKYVAKEIAAGLYDTTDGCCKYTIEVDARYYGIGCPGYDYETGLDYEYQVKEKEVIRSLENEMESDGRDML